MKYLLDICYISLLILINCSIFLSSVSAETASIEELLAASAQHVKSGEFEKALVQLNNAAKLEPKRALIFGLKAVALNQLSRYEEAESEAKKAISLGDDSGMIQVVLATSLLNRGKPGEALNAIEKAKELNEDSVDFHFIRGLVLTEKGQGQAAFDAFMDAVARNPALEGTVKEILASQPAVFGFLLKK